MLLVCRTGAEATLGRPPTNRPDQLTTRYLRRDAWGFYRTELFKLDLGPDSFEQPRA